MADPRDVIDVALAAGDQARRDLQARGHDVPEHLGLVEALEQAVANELAAVEFLRRGVATQPDLKDPFLWRLEVARIRAALDADPPGRLKSEEAFSSRMSLRLAGDLREARDRRGRAA